MFSTSFIQFLLEYLSQIFPQNLGISGDDDDDDDGDDDDDDDDADDDDDDDELFLWYG